MGLLVGGVSELVVAGLLEVREGIEIDDTEPSDLFNPLAHRPIPGDFQGPLLGVNDHFRATGIENGLTRLGDDPSRLVEAEVPVPGVALAFGGLNLEESGPVYGQVECRIGGSQCALAEVPREPGVDHEFDRLWAVRRTRRRLWFRPEEGLFGLEASGVCIGDVVRHDVQLALERHLAGKSDVKGVVHRLDAPDLRDPEGRRSPCKPWANSKHQ